MWHDALLNLAPLAGRGRNLREALIPGEGVQVYQHAAAFSERAPHPDLLPAKSGEKELQHRQAPWLGPERKGLVERGDLGGA
jgi:hypothetical protein